MRATRTLSLSILGLTAAIVLGCSGEVGDSLDVPLEPEDGEEEDEGEEDEAEDEGDEDEAEDEGEEDDGEVEVDLSELSTACDSFAAAVTAANAEAAESAATEDCWSGACKEIFEEAGNESLEMSILQVKDKDDRGMARAQVCSGDDCDTLVVYAEKADDEWRVVWLDEDEDHARQYIRGKAPAKK